MQQIVRFPSKHVWPIHYLFGILESISRSCFLLWHPKLKSINTNLLSMFLFWSFIPHFVSIILNNFYRWITWINRNCGSNKINNQEFPFWVNKYSEIENEGYQKFLVYYILPPIILHMYVLWDISSNHCSLLLSLLLNTQGWSGVCLFFYKLN